MKSAHRLRAWWRFALFLTDDRRLVWAWVAPFAREYTSLAWVYLGNSHTFLVAVNRVRAWHAGPPLNLGPSVDRIQ